MTVTLSTLAHRFNRITFEDEPPETFNVFYHNGNSVGNRYISYRAVCAHMSIDTPPDSGVIDMDRVYKECAGSSCDWRLLFPGLYYGLIVGPKTWAAVEECLEILRNDAPPEDDGTKVRHINHLGGVNYVSKPTLHEWDLTPRLSKILSAGFFADLKDKTLYSEDFTYTFKSHSGWNRAS